MLQVQGLVLLSPLSALTPLHGDLIQAHFFQFTYLLTFPKCMSLGYTSLLRLRPVHPSTAPPGCQIGISDFSSKLSSSPAPFLSATTLACGGNNVLVAQASSLVSSLMSLSHTRHPVSQSGGPVGSASGIPDSDTHTPPPPPVVHSPGLLQSHLPGLPASLAALPM